MIKYHQARNVAWIVCLLFLYCSSSALSRTHQLKINPIRIIFTDKKRVANIRVLNPTDHALSYAMSIISMQKDANGKMVEVQKSSELDELLKKQIRFSPKRATIEPGKRQIVKMMFRKPKELPPGEYRAWLQLLPIPTPEDNVKEGTAIRPSPMQISIDILVKSNFPIIIQSGGIKSEVFAESVRLDLANISEEGIVAKILLHRTGTASAFGDVHVNYIPANSNNKKTIGKKTDIAVYLSETKKNIPVLLKNITQAELNDGHLEVTFTPVIKEGARKTYRGKPSKPNLFSLPLP